MNQCFDFNIAVGCWAETTESKEGLAASIAGWSDEHTGEYFSHVTGDGKARLYPLRKQMKILNGRT